MAASLALVILVAFLTLPYLIFSLDRLAHQEELQELKPEKKKLKPWLILKIIQKREHLVNLLVHKSLASAIYVDKVASEEASVKIYVPLFIST